MKRMRIVGLVSGWARRMRRRIGRWMWTEGVMMRIRQGVYQGKVLLADELGEDFAVSDEIRRGYSVLVREYGTHWFAGWARVRYFAKVRESLERHGVDALEETVRVLKG